MVQNRENLQWHCARPARVESGVSWAAFSMLYRLSSLFGRFLTLIVGRLSHLFVANNGRAQTCQGTSAVRLITSWSHTVTIETYDVFSLALIVFANIWSHVRTLTYDEQGRWAETSVVLQHLGQVNRALANCLGLQPQLIKQQNSFSSRCFIGTIKTQLYKLVDIITVFQESIGSYFS